MNQDNGGVIGKLNTPTTTVASGVWTLQDQFEAQTSSIWPLAFPQTTIANSCRFNDGSSDNLVRTNASATNNTKYTYSVWVKRATLGTNQSILYNWYDGSNHAYIFFATDDKLALYDQLGGTDNINMKTTAVFRDVSAWYNIIVKVDTTESTQADRVRVFINGVEDSIGTRSTQPGSSASLGMKTNSLTNYMAISSFVNNSSNYLDGYIAEAVYIDGQALDATSFGAFNPVTNIWEPRPYVGTYGTNGFRLDFANSSDLGNDVSGNDNDFTANNLTSIDQSIDTCSNNFDTLNPLMAGTSSLDYRQANLKIVFGASSTWYFTTSTIGVTQGKWYCEVKVDNVGGETSVGIIPMETVAAQQNAASDYMGKESDSIGYVNNGQLYKTNSVQETTSSYTTNDIIGIAFNLDGNSIQFYKNGSSVGSAITLTSGLTYAVGVSGYNSTRLSVNFGSPDFSISSGNADANGFGNFEYAVPSGYFALCTKNLSEFG